MIIRNKYIPFKGFDRIAIYPFIFIKTNCVLTNEKLRHELIHIEQQKEMIALGVLMAVLLTLLFGFNYWYVLIALGLFYGVYIVNWVFELIKIPFEDKEAYKDLLFEKEAKQNEKNINYLKNRTRFAWIKYI